MSENPQALQLVFRQLTEGGYRVLYFFSDAGPVAGDYPLFTSHEELRDYALEVCQRLGAPEVSLLPVQDYNIGVEAARDRRAFRELFRRYGVNIPNPEVIRRPGNPLKRLFKK